MILLLTQVRGPLLSCICGCAVRWLGGARRNSGEAGAGGQGRGDEGVSLGGFIGSKTKGKL